MTRYLYLVSTKHYYSHMWPNLLGYLMCLQISTCSAVSNLPNNSFTSIFAVFPSYLLSFRCRCKGVYEVLTVVQGRALWFCEKSSLRPCGCEVFVLKNLVRPNLYTEKPLKRNDRRDRTTHQKKCRINEWQIRIRNSLPPLSNPHQSRKGVQR